MQHEKYLLSIIIIIDTLCLLQAVQVKKLVE